MSVVVCKLPKAGLGNQLFPLMHAFLFAKLNGLPVIVTGYHQLKIGPYLRKEKSKRSYRGYFTFQKNIVGEFRDKMKIKRLMSKSDCVCEPKIEKLPEGATDNKVFVFEKMTTYHDYFVHLKDHRNKVVEILYSILNPGIIKMAEREATPVIGVHIRMGDFRKLNDGEKYNGGHVRVPEEYFTKTINSIRSINGNDLPVSVFTDGFENEFSHLFKLGNVKMVQGNPDIVDMLLLSKSKIIIPTHGSTFSIWAAFLSDAPLIHYFKNTKQIRTDNSSEKYYEGVWNSGDTLLLNNIKRI